MGARRFALFWTSATTSYLGDGIRFAALPLLAASLTTSPGEVAAVAVAGGLPWLLFARGRGCSGVAAAARADGGLRPGGHHVLNGPGAQAAQVEGWPAGHQEHRHTCSYGVQ